jgi:hypothetical protein
VPIAVGTKAAERLRRADIEVSGLDHGGPSYELRIFLDNVDADAATDPTQDNGYAGSIYVYGYGERPAPAARSGDAPGSPRTLVTRSIIATDAVRAAAARGPLASVTLVPVDARPNADLGLDGVDVAVLIDAEPPPAT